MQPNALGGVGQLTLAIFGKRYQIGPLWGSGRRPRVGQVSGPLRSAEVRSGTVGWGWNRTLRSAGVGITWAPDSTHGSRVARPIA